MELEELLSNNKTLMAQWDYEKNNSIGLDPTQLTTHSHKKAYWLCEHGHSFQRVINQAVDNMKCPICNNRQLLKGYNDLETKFPEIAAEWDYKNNSGLKPCDVLCGSKMKVAWVCSTCGHHWETRVSRRTKEHSGCPKCGIQKSQQTRRENVEKGVTLPENLLKEWDYEKNKDIDPLKVSTQSGKVVGWICPNGHHYDARIQNRFKGSGCPICLNKELLVGFNDLKTTNPDLAAQWDYDKNIKTPEEYMASSDDYVFWKCEKCGFEWKATINSRIYRHNGCPNCAKIKRTEHGQMANALKEDVVLNGAILHKTTSNVLKPNDYIDELEENLAPNNLKKLRPDIAKLWDYEKNGDKRPEMYTVGSRKRFYFKCPKCGRSWEKEIDYICRQNVPQCPMCAIGKEHGYTPRKKKVIQCDKQGNEIKVWDSASDAARTLGICVGHICAVARGERKTCEGFIWKYIDEE